MGDLLAPRHEPRTAPARDHFVVQGRKTGQAAARVRSPRLGQRLRARP
jgi:hypothetical protein